MKFHSTIFFFFLVNMVQLLIDFNLFFVFKFRMLITKLDISYMYDALKIFNFCLLCIAKNMYFDPITHIINFNAIFSQNMLNKIYPIIFQNE